MPIDITATKPASQPGNPSWATNGGTRVAPTLGHKQTGFTNAERPAFNLFNWLIGFLADWAKYNEDATDELDAAKLSRTGSQDMTGNLLPHTDATLSLGDVILRWAVGAFVSLSATTLSLVTKVTIGVTDVLTETELKLAATADVLTTARKNQITTRSMPKALAFIKITTGGIIQILDGFGVTSATPENDAGHAGDAGNFTIVWATAFANLNYQVEAQVEFDGNSFTFAVAPLSTSGDGGAHPKTTAHCTFKLHNRSTGANIDFSTVGPGVPTAPIFLTIYAFGVQ